MLADTLFVILTIPLVDKCLTFHICRIHNLLLLHPNIHKPFHYEPTYKYLAVRFDMQCITFPDDENVTRGIWLTGNFGTLDTALHPADKESKIVVSFSLSIMRKFKSTVRFLL